MLIRVEEEHIIRGVPGSCDSCAVALALRGQGRDMARELGLFSKVVGIREVAQFMADFDEGSAVSPIEFYV